MNALDRLFATMNERQTMMQQSQIRDDSEELMDNSRTFFRGMLACFYCIAITAGIAWAVWHLVRRFL